MGKTKLFWLLTSISYNFPQNIHSTNEAKLSFLWLNLHSVSFKCKIDTHGWNPWSYRSHSATVQLLTELTFSKKAFLFPRRISRRSLLHFYATKIRLKLNSSTGGTRGLLRFASDKENNFMFFGEANSEFCEQNFAHKSEHDKCVL